MPIRSFGDKRTEEVWHGITSPRTRTLPHDILLAACRKLDMLNAATDLKDLRSPPGNRLEALKGNYAGMHSIRINDQWRIIFRWTPAGPHDVRIVDYH